MELAEAREDWARVVSLLSRHAVSWLNFGRPTGAGALLRAAVDLGRREHLPRATILPLLNLNAFLKNRDLQGARAAGREAVEATLQAGALDLLRASALNLALTYWVSGDWDEAEALYARHQDEIVDFPIDDMLFRSLLVLIRTARDEPVDLELAVAEVVDDDDAFGYMAALAAAMLAEREGDGELAARHFAAVVDRAHHVMGTEDDFAIVLPLGVEGVLAVGDIPEAERLLAYVADARARPRLAVGAGAPVLVASAHRERPRRRACRGGGRPRARHGGLS